jgi:hypothetical protein
VPHIKEKFNNAFTTSLGIAHALNATIESTLFLGRSGNETIFTANLSTSFCCRVMSPSALIVF